MKYKQGFFNPLHPGKYIGNPKNIVYRSWMEFRVMSKLDRDPTITRWASEEFYIPYIHPLDGKPHRYFVDLFFEKNTGKKYICEVKPHSQTQPPKSKGKRLLKEQVTFAINAAKWKAAVEWAKAKGCEFVIWTEKDLPGGR